MSVNASVCERDFTGGSEKCVFHFLLLRCVSQRSNEGSGSSSGGSSGGGSSGSIGSNLHLCWACEEILFFFSEENSNRLSFDFEVGTLNKNSIPPPLLPLPLIKRFSK